ncbi:hypothetical protein E1297_25150 [Roseibium sp. RKSG952]|nr:hypothetical protein [Roseibium sp. RKSG952]
MFGGVVVLGGAYGLHEAGILKLPAETDAQTKQLITAAETKITDLESQLTQLGQSNLGQETQQRVSEIETRLNGLQQSVQEAVSSAAASSGSKLASDVAELKSEVAALNERLSQASPQGAASGSGAGEAASAMSAAVTALETKVSDLQKTLDTTASEAGASSQAVASLQETLKSLQSELTALGSRVQNADATAKAAQTAVATSDTSLKTLADTQARASDTLSSLSTDMQTMSKTNAAAFDGIRSELAALSARLTTVENGMGDVTAREVAARALSVSALKAAVDSGQPYATELAAVKAGLPPGTDLKALEQYASTGVTPAASLIAQFPGVARKIYATFAQPEQSGDILDSLLASAKSIVTVRGPGSGNGTGPAATLRRMENAVSKGDLSAALTAYGELPETARTAGSDWAQKARARVEVDTLTSKASQEVLSELARKGS